MKKYLPAVIVWVVISGILFFGREWFEKHEYSVLFMATANTILFILSMVGFWIQSRSLHSSNAHAFVRGVFGSTLIKMLLILAALFIFILIAGGTVNKPALFVSMAIYVLYTSLEVYLLMKMVRKKSDV